MDKGILIIIIIGLLALSLFLFVILKIDFVLPDGYNFCKSKGYDSVSIFGSYSEKFGKVKCMSCYDGECSYGEFDVVKKWGIIKEVEKG